MTEIPIATQISIREEGLDEFWLQDQIYNNPTCLGLGDLDSIGREHRQASGDDLTSS